MPYTVNYFAPLQCATLQPRVVVEPAPVVQAWVASPGGLLPSEMEMPTHLRKLQINPAATTGGYQHACSAPGGDLPPGFRTHLVQQGDVCRTKDDQNTVIGDFANEHKTLVWACFHRFFI